MNGDKYKKNGITRLNKYKIQDIDDTGTTRYYGFVNETGDWYIMKYTISTSPKTLRYHRISVSRRVGLYSDAWNNRTSITYGYWNETF